MTQFSSEQQLGYDIARIGELYEEAKDCLNSITIAIDADHRHVNRLHELLQEMRDKVATQTQAAHKISNQ